MLYYNYTDELYHYGVKGMRWGVRKATKAVNRALYKDELNDAVKSLKRHKSKATAKIEKLDAKAKRIEPITERAKAKLAKNEELQKAFKQGIDDIDKAIIDAGKKKVHNVMDTCGGVMIWDKESNSYSSMKINNQSQYKDVKNELIRSAGKSVDSDTRKKIKEIDAKYDAALGKFQKKLIENPDMDTDEIDDIETSRLFDIDDLLTGTRRR